MPALRSACAVLATLCQLTVQDGTSWITPAGDVHRLWGIEEPAAETADARLAMVALRLVTMGETLACVLVDGEAVRCTVATGLHAGEDLACLLVSRGHLEPAPGVYRTCRPDHTAPAQTGDAPWLTKLARTGS